MHQRKPIGDIIRIAREKQGLSQTELAKQTGISIGTIKALESTGSDPRYSTVKRIVEELNISPYLIFGYEKMPWQDILGVIITDFFACNNDQKNIILSNAMNLIKCFQETKQNE